MRVMRWVLLVIVTALGSAAVGQAEDGLIPKFSEVRQAVHRYFKARRD